MTTDRIDLPGPLDTHLCYAVYSAGMAVQRLYKPLLDELGLTYPQYLVLTVLWSRDQQTVGEIAKSLALESSTLTPLLKRLETAGLLRRRRNPDNERQVIVELADPGRALQQRAGCLGDALLASSGDTPDQLGILTAELRALRDRIYDDLGEWQGAL